MARTIIQKRMSTVISNAIREVESVTDLDSDKGRLVEDFSKRILCPLLTSQFGVDNGVVVNHLGEKSKETDIIIYDNRILPPFIKEESMGVYPIESVIATIEVKSKLDKKRLIKIEEKAKELRETIFNRKTSLLQWALYPGLCKPPLCAVLAFRITINGDEGIKELTSKEEGRTWLRQNIKHLFAICVVNNFSWLNVSKKGWSICKKDELNEETKRFFAVLVDNVRTRGEERYRNLIGEHKDFLSAYIRK